MPKGVNPMVFQRLNEAGKARERRKRRITATHPGVANKRRPGTYQCRWRNAYRVPMGDGRTEDWPTYLRRMTRRPEWSVARLARESHIHRGTIFKWMAGKGGVTIASVRSIAVALGDDIENALRAAGEAAYQPEPDPYSDEELRKIATRTDIDEDTKVEIIQIMRRRRDEDRRRREVEAAEMIQWLRRRDLDAS